MADLAASSGGADGGSGDAGAAAAALAAGGGNADGSAGGGASSGGGQNWLQNLPEELQADQTLTRFKSVEELARGHVESHKVAKSKAVPLPGDTDESRKAFADALRPENAEAYDFGELPAGMKTELVDGFRKFSFDSGMPPHMAKATFDFYNESMGADVTAANDASQKDVDDYAKEFGSGYAEKVDATRKMLESFTGSPLELSEADMNRLDIKLGSSGLMKFMFAVHDRVGDLNYAGEGGGDPGMQGIAPENAETTLNAKMADADWRSKAKTKGSAEARENENLQKLMAQHRLSQNNRA